MQSLKELYVTELEALTRIYACRFVTSPVERQANEHHVRDWMQKMHTARDQMSAHPEYNPSMHLDFLLNAHYRDFPLGRPVPQFHDPLYTAYRVLIRIASLKKQQAANKK